MRNWVERQFKLSTYNTTIKTELIAGITTFLTMAYVLAVVPNTMGTAGFDRNTILTSAIILIILTSTAMGLFTNRPFALAPGLGSVGIVTAMAANEGVSPGLAAGILFLSAVLSVIISFAGLREAVVKAIPASLKHAVTAGIGLFIALIGAKSVGLIVANEAKKSLAFGDLSSPKVILVLIGFILMLIVKSKNIKGGMILVILATTIIGIPMSITKVPSAFFSLPNGFEGFGGQLLQLDILGALRLEYLPFVIALFIPDFFSTFGTLFGVSAQAGYLDEDGNLPGVDKCFQVDALASITGSLFCMPSVTTYLESSAGVEAGGKTGLTVVFTSILFALMLFFTPLALMIPSAATAPVLIYIGVNMLKSMKNINYDDITEYIPAFLCVTFTIFANNIANGICIAIPSYLILKIASGKIKEVSISMYVVTIICLLYFYSIIAL